MNTNFYNEFWSKEEKEGKITWKAIAILVGMVGLFLLSTLGN